MEGRAVKGGILCATAVWIGIIVAAFASPPSSSEPRWRPPESRLVSTRSPIGREVKRKVARSGH